MTALFSTKVLAGALLAIVLFESECLAQAGIQVPTRMAPVPPTLPPVPSPIQYFRRLLDSPAAEREQLLASKSPEQRRVLTNSVRIYLDLSPDERESRLRAIELRFYLSPLLRLPATNRALIFQTVPETFRPLVQERLDYWDGLSPEMRQQLLDSDRLIRVGPSAILMSPPPNRSVRGYSSNQLDAMDAAARQWHLYPSAKREEIVETFRRLYQVTPQEKNKTLSLLPLTEAERAQIEKSLEKFFKLNSVEQKLVVKSFTKFATLSPEERRQFLRNAEAWQKMSTEDRERWRYLVNNLPPLPPLPPGLLQPPMPPMPKVPLTTPRPGTALVATNGPRF